MTQPKNDPSIILFTCHVGLYSKRTLTHCYQIIINLLLIRSFISLSLPIKLTNFRLLGTLIVYQPLDKLPISNPGIHLYFKSMKSFIISFFITFFFSDSTMLLSVVAGMEH